MDFVGGLPEKAVFSWSRVPCPVHMGVNLVPSMFLPLYTLAIINRHQCSHLASNNFGNVQSQLILREGFQPPPPFLE